MTTAPDFNGTYPSAGEIIGPLWQSMWERLADGRPHCGVAMAEDFASRRGVSAKTVLNLLRQAAKAGHLSTETRRQPSGRKAKWYRRMP